MKAKSEKLPQSKQISEKSLKEGHSLSPEKQILAILAANLRRQRKARGWTQADLAHHINAHVTHVSRIELETYMPSLDFAIKAANAFGVSIESLITPEGKPADLHINDLAMSERLKLLDSLDSHERDALFTIIDALLTKHRIRQFLDAKTIP
jgi:transcriptional regulator with XRE-family HTH domain